MTSPITIDLEGVPLKTTLTLLLQQLGLILEIREGEMIIVTSESNQGNFQVQHQYYSRRGPEAPTPLQLMQQRAERGDLPLEGIRQLIEWHKAIGELRKVQSELDQLPQRRFPGPVGP